MALDHPAILYSLISVIRGPAEIDTSDWDVNALSVAYIAVDETMTHICPAFEFSFSVEDRNETAQRLLTKLSSKYDFLGSGLYRAVFKMRGDRVLKIPLNEAGEFCNDGEGSIRDKTCAIGRWLEIDGFICVIQEFVEEASLSTIKDRLGRIPYWVAGIDCSQVGFTSSGQLKAFDFVHP